MADAEYTATAGHCFAQLSLFEFRRCRKCAQDFPATRDNFHVGKRGLLKSVCKACHHEHYGRPSVTRRQEQLKAELGVLHGKHRARLVCWLEMTCRHCGEIKPYDCFPIDSAKGKRRTRCNACKQAAALRVFAARPELRQAHNDRIRKRRDILRGDPEYRQRRRAWKRRYRAKLQERGLTTNGTPRIQPVELSAERHTANGARRLRAGAMRWRRQWLKTLAPDACVVAWYAATGKPWNNPRLTQAERWRVQYAADNAFRAKEVLKAQLRKESRRARIEAQSDGTVTPRTLGALFAAATCCTYCGAQLASTEKTADHVVPLVRGGMHAIDNLVITCSPCNTRKGRKTLDEWLIANPPTSRWARSISNRLQACWASQPEASVTGPMLRAMATELTTALSSSAGTSRANAA